MRFPDRLRPWFMLIALLPAMLVVNYTAPLDTTAAILLLLYGITIGEINERLYPRAARENLDKVGPSLPWNRMGAGDKLEYFLPGIAITAMGALMLSVVWMARGEGFRYWTILAAGLFVTAAGLWELRRRWHRRWAALEVE
ncbi:hypothetical protein [Erythrobacter colymbi]|uniref:hypothetical protein n=1 Tax=Erythrobacter colymbi TaxID=1161202 RepID=UPI0011811E59|nr:hypothetical protein [Erythrobacter colymbi]